MDDIILFNQLIRNYRMAENIVQVTDINKLIELQYKKKPIIIQFYTEWCPPCKPCFALIQKQLHQNSSKFIVAKINADQTQQLNMQYQIEGVPTTILLNSDNSVNEKVIGYDPKKIKDLLEKVKKQSNSKI